MRPRSARVDQPQTDHGSSEKQKPGKSSTQLPFPERPPHGGQEQDRRYDPDQGVRKHHTCVENIRLRKSKEIDGRNKQENHYRREEPGSKKTCACFCHFRSHAVPPTIERQLGVDAQQLTAVDGIVP